MPLPSVEQFIGTDVTEQGFKDAQKQLVEYVGNEVPKKIDTDAAFATKANKATTLAGYGIADAYTKAQVDSSITAVSGGHKAYQTLADAQAAQASLPANTIVEVTNDPTSSNNGTYQWNGTTLTKSAYDPLTQAKTYTDSKLPTFDYLYSGSNLVGSKTKALAGYVNGLSNFEVSGNASVIIPVKAGELIYFHNNRQDMTQGGGFGWGFFADIPVNGTARLTSTNSTLTDATTSLKYVRATVPATAKYLVLNTKFGANTATWNANYTGFINSFVEGTASISKIDSIEYISEKDYLAAGKTTTLAGNIYDPAVFRANSYISNATPPVMTGGQVGWTVAVMPAELGRKYYAKIESLTFPFEIAAYNGPVASLITIPSGTALVNVTLNLIDEANKIYEIVFDPSFTGGALAITTKVESGGYNHNIENTLKVYADWPYSAETKQVDYSQYDSQLLMDIELRKKFGSVARNNELLSKVGNIKKSIYCFGDSITQGTQGGYTKYLQMGLDATIQNYGSSGANTNRLYGIVLGKASRNGYDGTTVYPAKDYMFADIVTIMIGTNDFNYGDPYWDSLSTIPTDNVYAHVADNTTDAYFESFPANFAGNVGACIEYIRWKNPKCKIYLIAPPQRTGTPTMLSRVPFIKAVADYYAVTFINGTSENGLCAKDISVWSYDDLHLNTLGNEIFGKYLVKKIASS
jgi:lysophospholipase L1-like esterase